MDTSSSSGKFWGSPSSPVKSNGTDGPRLNLREKGAERYPAVAFGSGSNGSVGVMLEGRSTAIGGGTPVAFGEGEDDPPHICVGAGNEDIAAGHKMSSGFLSRRE